jgi:hypothetical protein
MKKKIGDVVRCTSKETNESKLGIVVEVGAMLYRVCFGDPKWDEGYWTEEATELICGKSKRTKNVLDFLRLIQ